MGLPTWLREITSERLPLGKGGIADGAQVSDVGWTWRGTGEGGRREEARGILGELQKKATHSHVHHGTCQDPHVPRRDR